MNTVERRARRLLRWYPRSWRATHEEEFVVLLEDSIVDRPFWPGRSLNIVMNALRVRSEQPRTSYRRLLVSSSAPLVVLIAVIGFTTNGFGLLSVSGPTKGGMPHSQRTIVPYNRFPTMFRSTSGRMNSGTRQRLTSPRPMALQRFSARSDCTHLRQQPDDASRS